MVRLRPGRLKHQAKRRGTGAGEVWIMRSFPNVFQDYHLGSSGLSRDGQRAEVGRA